MRTHEYYEELCALLPIGQLSATEYDELCTHLKECLSCRRATGDFSAILSDMPVAEADVNETDLATLQGESYRDRFIKRALSEGVPFTSAVMNPVSAKPEKVSWFRSLVIPTFAVAALILIVVLSVQVVRLSEAQGNAVQIQRTELVPQPPQTTVDQSASAVSELTSKIAELETRSSEQQRMIADLKTEATTSRAQSESERQQLAITTDRLTQLQKQAADTNAQLASAKLDLEHLRSEKDNLAANLVSQQYKINDLSAQVREKEAIADRERELNSVAKDVREMMGARNLHILDVSDVDGNGRSKKSFGRVFLVAGKSLIFYAFDLGDRGNPAKVSFQAWGQLEGRQAPAKSLGVFYVDDHEQKRWVLKVNDPQKLSAINSVFVTVEPLGGTDRPTGKKLLYAYFGNPANHP